MKDKNRLFEVKELLLSEIKIEDRGRVNFGDMTELKEAILSHGLLYPVLVNEHYVLIDGGRRMQAHKELKIQTIHVRIMPGVTSDDLKVLERISNTSRKDFDWHEELKIIYDLHTMWEETHKSWSYRKTSAKIGISLGKLSSDIALAVAIRTFPALTDHKSKSKARDAYKKMQAQAESIQAVDGLSDLEKSRLADMLSGSTDISKVAKAANIAKPKPNIPSAMHREPSISSGVPREARTAEVFNNEQPVEAPAPVEQELPQHVYEVISNEKFIAKIPDNTVGFIELDPPYAIDFNNTYGGLGDIATTEDDWSIEQLTSWMLDMLPELYSKLLDNSWVLIWTAKEHWQWTNQLAEDAGFNIQHPGIWAKPGGSSNTPSTNMISNYEMFLLLRKGKAMFNVPSLPSVISFPPVPASQRAHQWEKPMPMYDFFMKVLGKPGSIFLSPFAGSGNAMVSAALNNMIPMGCDMKQKYCYQFYNNLKNHFYTGDPHA